VDIVEKLDAALAKMATIRNFDRQWTLCCSASLPERRVFQEHLQRKWSSGLGVDRRTGPAGFQLRGRRRRKTMTVVSPICLDAKTRLETEINALRRRLARAHRILAAGKIWPLTKGHVSARIPGSDNVVILGRINSEGRSLIDTDIDDIATVDLEGNWLEGRIEPVDERFLHLEIMKTRPDVNSIVHAHPPMAMAFGIANVNILPVGNRGAIFAPRVPILDFDRPIDTPERGQMCRDALGDGLALVLKNNGVAVCGDTIENAMMATFALEETAQLHWTAAQLGRVDQISPGEVGSALTGARREEYYSHVWGHYARMDPWFEGAEKNPRLT
jgi:ribulose-5-phosphate 4-epimerase/fuculose-1-phosphate aldolase